MFFTTELADGLSLNPEWQQISSEHQDSSEYCGWSQQCSISDCLHSSTNFKLISCHHFTIIHSLELFTSALADEFSLESEWQQVSSSLQDSSQYSGRSQ